MLVSYELRKKSATLKRSDGGGPGVFPVKKKNRLDESVPSRDDRIRTDDLFNVTEAL